MLKTIEQFRKIYLGDFECARVDQVKDVNFLLCLIPCTQWPMRKKCASLSASLLKYSFPSLVLTAN